MIRHLYHLRCGDYIKKRRLNIHRCELLSYASVIADQHKPVSCQQLVEGINCSLYCSIRSEIAPHCIKTYFHRSDFLNGKPVKLLFSSQWQVCPCSIRTQGIPCDTDELIRSSCMQPLSEPQPCSVSSFCPSWWRSVCVLDLASK